MMRWIPLGFTALLCVWVGSVDVAIGFVGGAAATALLFLHRPRNDNDAGPDA